MDPAFGNVLAFLRGYHNGRLGLGMILVLKQFVAKKTEWQSILKEVERWRENEQHRRVW